MNNKINASRTICLHHYTTLDSAIKILKYKYFLFSSFENEPNDIKENRNLTINKNFRFISFNRSIHEKIPLWKCFCDISKPCVILSTTNNKLEKLIKDSEIYYKCGKTKKIIDKSDYKLELIDIAYKKFKNNDSKYDCKTKDSHFRYETETRLILNILNESLYEKTIYIKIPKKLFKIKKCPWWMGKYDEELEKFEREKYFYRKSRYSELVHIWNYRR